MENLRIKAIVRLIISMVSCIPFFLLWWFIFLMASAGISEGSLSVFRDAFGEWTLWLGWIIALLTSLSIFYLRVFVKKEWLVHLIAYFLTFIFLSCSFILANIGESRFSEFTKEKWMQYPEQRITMYFDLEQKNIIKGCTKEEVENLLGKPNNIGSDGTYIYDDLHNNSVYFMFDGELALGLSYIE